MTTETEMACARVTELLPRWRAGDPDAAGQVVALVYDELRELAESHLRRERRNHTLQPTALVHEVYARLAAEKSPPAHNRAHLLAIAARLMREILVNHALRKKRAKRGGQWQRVGLDESLAIFEERCGDLLALDEALGRLREREQRLSVVLELRFFGGLTIDEIAEALGASPRTIQQDWAMARAWMRRELASA